MIHICETRRQASNQSLNESRHVGRINRSAAIHVARHDSCAGWRFAIVRNAVVIAVRLATGIQFAVEIAIQSRIRRDFARIENLIAVAIGRQSTRDVATIGLTVVIAIQSTSGNTIERAPWSRTSHSYLTAIRFAVAVAIRFQPARNITAVGNPIAVAIRATRRIRRTIADHARIRQAGIVTIWLAYIRNKIAVAIRAVLIIGNTVAIAIRMVRRWAECRLRQ